MHRKTISGNALFFILIAIFLLGGVTVLLMRSSGQSDDTGSTERASISASKVIQSAATIETAIDTLRSRGCSESQLSFTYDSDNNGVLNSSDTDYNANAPTDESCHIYSVKGAGINRNLTAFTIGTVGVSAIQDIGTTGKDLYYWLNNATNDPLPADGLGSSLCDQINRQLKNGFNISSLPAATGIAGNNFTGDYTVGDTYGDAGAETGMAGVKAGCVLDGARYVFYRVVLKR